MSDNFKFLDPGELVDDDLELVLVEKAPADEAKGYFPKYRFEMRNVKTGETMGEISLRVGNNDNTKYGGNVGYGVDEKFRGHHYSARSLKLISALAKQHGLNTLWVTCNPENVASRKTCELAGGKLVEICDLPADNEQYLKGERKKCRYRFDL